MEQIRKDLRKLCSTGHEGYDAVALLQTILNNIIEHPDEVKYRNLSTKSARFKRALDSTEFFATMISLNFQRKVIYFDEKWVLEHATTIWKAKVTDVLAYCEELLDRYSNFKEPPRPDITPLSVLRQEQKKKQEYWERLTQQAEEDRLAKLERESRTVKVLQKHQNKEKEKLERKKRQFRSKYDLLKPLPVPPFDGTF